MGKYEDALSEYEKAIEIDPKFIVAQKKKSKKKQKNFRKRKTFIFLFELEHILEKMKSLNISPERALRAQNVFYDEKDFSEEKSEQELEETILAYIGSIPMRHLYEFK